MLSGYKADILRSIFACTAMERETILRHQLDGTGTQRMVTLSNMSSTLVETLITIPRGGVPALPPSFLVNQLLDLMSRQRREVVPKCATHLNQELLFCETCDSVFCTLCAGGSHSNGPGEHTIIPFSIAIKRMSEILLYKANECIAKLSQAEEAVTAELHRLDVATEACLEQVSSSIAELSATLDKRKAQLLEQVTQASQAKRQVLEEQLALVAAEKQKVEKECDGLQYQVEVRSISQRIASLGSEFKHNDSVEQVEAALQRLGRVRTSTTFPSLSSAALEQPVPAVARLPAQARLWTVDYHGCPRKTGGDPVAALLVVDPDEPPPPSSVPAAVAAPGASPSKPAPLPCQVTDLDDGSYTIKFRPWASGRYLLKLSVMDRPIQNYPLRVEVTPHNNPVRTFGGARGSGKNEFLQPVAVAVDADGRIAYVLDTGNSRIKVLAGSDLAFQRHIETAELAGRSCTGIACTKAAGLVVVNWRTKQVIEMSEAGEVVRTFTHPPFQEPTAVAVESTFGHILVADNGACCVFVFDSGGKPLFQVGRKGSGPGCFNMISGVATAPSGEILVADNDRIHGRIVASRVDKARSYVQVLSLKGQVVNTIDSHDAPLKRPCGVAVTDDQHVVVVDLGNDTVSKYRYW
ncbi:hypothetical protein FOCC_FOCC007919 [Frankliniella occidentalis]|nr:hypothetical protein FOCC_FOCC007919 [Frankliniella occidentalis]